jgi:2-hydroxy-3-keto-5-methylthiopentenyl-1-phosphate phosphatase
MPPALLRVPPPGDGAPLSILVDYDGTISLRDIGDELMALHFDDPAQAAARDAAFDAGTAGSRETMRWNMEVLPADRDLLLRTAAQVPQDPAFPAFVRTLRALGAVVEVVSDGLAFYIEANLAALDPQLADLPLAMNANRVDGPVGLTFPYSHPTCHVCGTCKRERVRVHRAAGRAVVMIGDGTSDRYAAHEADVTFAKGKLAAWCRVTGHAFVAWEGFAEVEAWVVAALGDGRLPASPADLAAWQAARPRPGEPPICGPEAALAGLVGASAAPSERVDSEVQPCR